MKRRLIMTAVLASTLLLTACTGGITGPDTTVISIIKAGTGALNPRATSDTTPYAYWTDQSQANISLTTFGSGSCPLIPETMQIKVENEVLLYMHKYTGACTADLGPHTTVFKAPAKISRSTVVSLELVLTDGSIQNVDLDPVTFS